MSVEIFQNLFDNLYCIIYHVLLLRSFFLLRFLLVFSRIVSREIHEKTNKFTENPHCLQETITILICRGHMGWLLQWKSKNEVFSRRHFESGFQRSFPKWATVV